jgi:hypothetical protein
MVPLGRPPADPHLLARSSRPIYKASVAMNARSSSLVSALFLLATACENELPTSPAAFTQAHVSAIEAQADDACGQTGEACCEAEACAEGNECSDGQCVVPFLEPREIVEE